MRSRWFDSIGFALFCLLAALPVSAEDNWRARAFLDVATPGMTEAVVPPELVSRTNRGLMDFVLTGPNGRARAFELYWREPVGEVRALLKPTRVQLDQDKGFIWEATLPEKLVTRRLHITLDQKGTIGKIDIYARIGDQWSSLVRNAAVFTTAGVRQASIDIPESAYPELRLYITGYDRKARQTLSPIKTVMVEGDRMGEDYVEQVLALNFQQSMSEGLHVIEAVLPGDGLWIGSLNLKTEAQFQGEWQAGLERISGGRWLFEAVCSGRMAHLNRTLRDLGMEVNQAWSGRSLVLKLDAGARYIGDVVSLTATVRLPRLVFAAEKAGRFTARTGDGKNTAVLDFPGDGYRKTNARLTFTVPEINPHWRLGTLVEKYQLKGGHFSPEGYSWRAPVNISAPGYFRLRLNLQASLAYRRTGIRMVRDGFQVPYVTGRLEGRTIDVESISDYDTQKNISTWLVRLPQASSHWKELTFYASGIFKRTIKFQKPKPGTRGWRPWRQMVWENRGQGEIAQRLSLRDLPDDTDEIRMVMAHGDNQPITISRITAGYTAPTIYFLAHTAGEYSIYGGNPDSSAPQYDLSLIQAELFSVLPAEAGMGELETFQRSEWQTRIGDAFKEKGWGLYAVLGLVTLVLIIVVVRLFPKPADKDPS